MGAATQSPAATQSTGDSDEEDSASPPDDAPTLTTLPADVLISIFSVLEIRSIGRIMSTCDKLGNRVDAVQAWRNICLQEGLPAEDPKGSLRRAAECGHHASDLPSDAFDSWTCSMEVLPLTCCCANCKRQYEVVLAMGFVDTSSFASKLVTRASFRATHMAPRRHREFEKTWDRQAASAARQAEQRATRNDANDARRPTPVSQPTAWHDTGLALSGT